MIQVLFILIMCVFHFIWVGCLAVCQTYQVVWLAMTTNERMNASRYKHFQRGESTLLFSSGCNLTLFQSAEEFISRPLIEGCSRIRWTSLVSDSADSDPARWTGPSSSRFRGRTRTRWGTRSPCSVITSWSDLRSDKKLIKSFHHSLPLICFLLGQSCQRDLVESVSGNCAISEQTLFKFVLSAIVGGTLSSLFTVTVFVYLYISNLIIFLGHTHNKFLDS